MGWHFFLLAPLIQTIRYIVCWPFVSSSFLSYFGPRHVRPCSPASSRAQTKNQPMPFHSFLLPPLSLPPPSSLPLLPSPFSLLSFLPGRRTGLPDLPPPSCYNSLRMEEAVEGFFLKNIHVLLCFIFRRQPGSPVASLKNLPSAVQVLSSGRWWRRGGGRAKRGRNQCILLHSHVSFADGGRSAADGGGGGRRGGHSCSVPRPFWWRWRPVEVVVVVGGGGGGRCGKRRRAIPIAGGGRRWSLPAKKDPFPLSFSLPPALLQWYTTIVHDSAN